MLRKVWGNYAPDVELKAHLDLGIHLQRMYLHNGLAEGPMNPWQVTVL